MPHSERKLWHCFAIFLFDDISVLAYTKNTYYQKPPIHLLLTEVDDSYRMKRLLTFWESTES